MADEELDAGLVERAREIIFGQPSFYTDTDVETLRVRRALLSLPIPAAALNALARGEAVVFSAKLDHSSDEATAGARALRDTFGATNQIDRVIAVHKAMLAASPYAAKE